jgi:hypothetical protein
MKLDFNIKLGKWALFSILIIVILYGSYYSLFGLREGFEPGKCPKGCWGHQVDPDGNCQRFNVEDGYNTFYVKVVMNKGDPSVMPISLNIPPGVYTGDSLAKEMQTLISGVGSNPATNNFTCKFHDPEYKKPGTKDVDPNVNQLEFNLNNNKDYLTTTVTILFSLNAPYDNKTPLESLFKTDKIVLTGSMPQFTELNLTNPYFPSSLKKPSSICPQVCISGVTKDKQYCQYDKDCLACPTVTCRKGVCPNPGTPPVTPPPSPSKKGGKGGGGGGGGGGGVDKPDCSQAKCYAQPLDGTNDQFNQFDPYHPNDPKNPKYDEDVGFCGISNTDENGMKFMFGCNSTSKCTKKNLDCNTECQRDKDGKIIGNCQEYPCTKGVNWNKKDCVVKNPGKSDPGSSGKGDNSGYNYYDADMDDYMNELMKPGQMTPNQMYNFSQARYGCDASKYGCCADGFTYKKDASGNNCFDFLPYYNPIVFRGGA